MPRQQSYPIRAFQPVSRLEDTVDKGTALEQGQNLLLRPQGGVCGPPIYENLWAIGVNSTVQTVMRNLTFSGTPVGDTAPRRASNKTIAVEISRQGKHLLVFYDLTTDECRGGPFYMGDDGTFSGDYDFTTGTPSYTVLAVGLDAAARWYGTPIQGTLHLGNGVDDNVIVQLARSATPGKWRKAASNTVPSAPVISLVTPATEGNTQATSVIPRTDGDVIFTANPENYPGASGNGRISITVTPSGVAVAISSTLTGQGTLVAPYAYTLTTGTSALISSNAALVTFVNQDSKAISLFSAAGTGSNLDLGADGPVIMSGGAGTGVSDGFTSRTVTLHARYWDPGVDGHGYESPSSPLSNEVIIPNTANNDILVTVTCNAGAEGGRFGFIRLYMQFGEDDEAVWKLVDPDNPIPNTGSTATKQITTETEFGQDMSVNQNRPLPHKFTAFTQDQVFRAGLTDYPERLYGSKVATPDEIAPEGVSLMPDDYDLVAAQASTAGGREVTALIATESRLEFHTAAGFTIINPLDTSQRVFPQSTAGAMNQSAVTLYEGKQMYYLGADLQLRSMSTVRPGDFASTVATSQFAAASAIQYIKERVDLDAITRDPSRVWVFPDSSSQHLWMFMPATTGAQIGFAYDLLNKGILGPFSYPQIYGTCQMEPGRPEILLCDTAGRLFVWDTTAQMDQGKNAWGTQAAFTANATATAMPARYDGYGYVDYDHDGDGTASRFYQAYEAVLETAMLDLGTPGRRKAFQAALWRTIQDSRCFVEVTFIGLSGQEETFRYGDVNDDPNCRAGLALSDTALRVKLRIIGAENKKWALRDLVLLFTQQGQV